MNSAAIDHLVIAAAELETGRDWLRHRLGVEPQPGGQHLTMGTHNALLGLGPGCYLEVLAIDPSQPAPDRPRWFGLDRPDVRRRLEQGPCLLHWVARVDEETIRHKGIGESFGRLTPMARGEWRWQLTIPDDGALPLGGAGPSLICWHDRHPADVLPESGCRLQKLTVVTPQPERLQAALSRWIWPKNLDIVKGESVALRMVLQTPAGLVSLS